MSLAYVSICSGIEAASAAWHSLGWNPLAFAEIEPFPSAVLKHHHPTVPNLGDMTRFHEWPELTPDVLVGGTPCQAFSVAGLRKGLADPRGNLTLVFLGLVARMRPRWVVWENVPGVLSDQTGAFGALLGGLGELGYGFAYRVLDAQYVRVDSHPWAVPQRRRRVFVVGHLGDWQRAAAVLFERACLSGNPPPRREAGKGVAPTVRSGAPNGGAGHGARSGDSKDELIVPVSPSAFETERTLFAAEVAPALVSSGRGVERTGESRGQDPVCATITKQYASHYGRTGGNNGGVAAGQLVPEVAWALQHRDSKGADSDTKQGHLLPVTIPIQNDTRGQDQNGLGIGGDVMFTFDQGSQHAVAHSLRTEGFDASEDGTGRGTPMVPVAFAQNTRDEVRIIGGDVAGALPAQPGMKQQTYLHIPASAVRRLTPLVPIGIDGSDLGFALRANASHSGDKGDGGMNTNTVVAASAVRRLTPRECERLQGFPDDYTAIPWRGKPACECPDGPRYKALGNSMAVNVMRWIGQRIELVESHS